MMKRRDFLKNVGASAMMAGTVSTPLVSWLCEATAFAQFAEQSFDPARGNLRNPQVLRYAVRDGAIIGENGAFYNNRPLYCPHLDAAVLGGDRPVLRFLKLATYMAPFPLHWCTTAKPNGFKTTTM